MDGLPQAAQGGQLPQGGSLYEEGGLHRLEEIAEAAYRRAVAVCDRVLAELEEVLNERAENTNRPTDTRKPV